MCLRAPRISLLMYYEGHSRRSSSAVNTSQPFQPLNDRTPAPPVGDSNLPKMPDREPTRSLRVKKVDSRNSPGQKRSGLDGHPASEAPPRKKVRFAITPHPACQRDSGTSCLAGGDCSDLRASAQSQPEHVCQPEPQLPREDERASESERGHEPGSHDSLKPNSKSKRAPEIKNKSTHRSEKRSQLGSEDRGAIKNSRVSKRIIKNVGGESERGPSSCRSKPQAMEVQEDSGY